MSVEGVGRLVPVCKRISSIDPLQAMSESVVDASGGQSYVNRAFADMIGWPRAPSSPPG